MHAGDTATLSVEARQPLSITFSRTMDNVKINCF